jgi:hypothetical protein
MPQAPQFVGSLTTVLHAPAHSIWPDAHCLARAVLANAPTRAGHVAAAAMLWVALGIDAAPCTDDLPQSASVRRGAARRPARPAAGHSGCARAARAPGRATTRGASGARLVGLGWLYFTRAAKSSEQQHGAERLPQTIDEPRWAPRAHYEYRNTSRISTDIRIRSRRPGFHLEPVAVASKISSLFFRRFRSGR